ncbi:hypothetical protein T484DRAFT_1935385 [Baffinella frigidus]|nr:hypothetical protein T484DRAFT_1935385 [Cryptophyta sp. CCMP2293]
MPGFRRTSSAETLLVVATTLHVVCAFAPVARPSFVPRPTVTRSKSTMNLRRPAVSARLLWRSAKPSLSSSFTLARQATTKLVEEEDFRHDLLEEAVDKILSNRGLDQAVGSLSKSALHHIDPPHIQKFMSVLKTVLSNPHLLPPGDGPNNAAAHALSAALPGMLGQAHAALPHLTSTANSQLLSSLPLWAVMPSVALLAFSSSRMLHLDASAASSIVPFLRAPEGTAQPSEHAQLSRRRMQKARRAAIRGDVSRPGP